ncbi:hypothetical protein [Bifidobacterium longum]|uniref:hypothetical protein n=1 Tax=Bifidobacterium longum TaxID=216816 RepID=UPI0004A2937C|nr:hypothetical protein [Bifidobacterium longum]
MMGCDGACAAGFDLVFIGLPLLSLYEIPMLIWFIWRAFHWKRDDKDWLKGTAILAIAVVAPMLLWLSAWYALRLSAWYALRLSAWYAWTS